MYKYKTRRDSQVISEEEVKFTNERILEIYISFFSLRDDI